MLRPAILMLACLATAPASARPPARCLDVKTSPATSLTGILSLKTFPGSPNFESVARGDEPEPTLILTLTAAICADDGGELIDSAQRFRTVQIYSDSDALTAQLRRAVGRTVRVSGQAFGAHTGHHHAPLVLSVTAFRVIR